MSRQSSAKTEKYNPIKPIAQFVTVIAVCAILPPKWQAGVGEQGAESSQLAGGCSG